MAYISFIFDPNTDFNVKSARLVEIHVSVSDTHEKKDDAVEEALNVLSENDIDVKGHLGSIEWSEE